MSVFVIRIIAYVTMLIDHLTLSFADGTANGTLYLAGRGIGRLAFPLFAWLLVEGYFHTRDLKKYILRLGIMIIISEPGFDLLLIMSGLSQGIFEHQNVCITLLLGLLAITAIDNWRVQFADRPFIYNSAATMVIVLSCSLASAVRCDYSALGVLFILMLYFFRGRTLVLCIGTFIWAVVCAFFGHGLEEFAIISVVLAGQYNGELGPRFGKRLNYLFYPVHLLVLGLILWGMRGFVWPI